MTRTMLKTLTAGCMLCAASAAHAAAQLAPGPYVSVFGGVSDIDFDVGGTDGSTLRLGSSGGSFGAGLGFLAPLGHAAIGLEGNFSAETMSSSRDVQFFNEDTNQTSPGRLDIDAEYSFGVAVLLGGFVGQSLVYGRVGAQWLRAKSELRVEGMSGSRRASETFQGPRAGIGAAIPLIHERLSLRLDYSRSFYREKSGTEPEQDQFTVGVALVF